MPPCDPACLPPSHRPCTTTAAHALRSARAGPAAVVDCGIPQLAGAGWGGVEWPTSTAGSLPMSKHTAHSVVSPAPWPAGVPLARQDEQVRRSWSSGAPGLMGAVLQSRWQLRAKRAPPSPPLPRSLLPSSHYLHFYPSCVCWAIRWHTQPDSALGRHLAADPAAAAAWERASIRDLVLLPMIPYTVWALLYYLKVRQRVLLLCPACCLPLVDARRQGCRVDEPARPFPLPLRRSL